MRMIKLAMKESYYRRMTLLIDKVQTLKVRFSPASGGAGLPFGKLILSGLRLAAEFPRHSS